MNIRCILGACGLKDFKLNGAIVCIDDRVIYGRDVIEFIRFLDQTAIGSVLMQVQRAIKKPVMIILMFFSG